jgi:hypothetical protein
MGQLIQLIYVQCQRGKKRSPDLTHPHFDFFNPFWIIGHVVILVPVSASVRETNPKGRQDAARSEVLFGRIKKIAFISRNTHVLNKNYF